MSTTPRVAVLYGSQTGTAQEVAERIARGINLRGLQVLLCAMNAYPIAQLPTESLAVFVASTTGDGEVPDNMKLFWRFLLRKDLPADSLSSLRFAVFGLGDSTYEKFNAVARRLHARLVQLGAAPLVDRGLADDQAPFGLETEYDSWVPKLWAALPFPATATISEKPIRLVSRYSIAAAATDAVESVEQWRPAAGVGSTPRTYVAATVTSNTRLTSADWTQDVRHIVFSSPDFSYQPGDVAYFIPENDSDQVAALCHRLKVDPTALVSVTATTPAGAAISSTNVTPLLSLPQYCTYSQLFARHLDILGIPRRSFLEQLSLYASNEEEAEKLLEMAGAAGTDLYHSYCYSERRTYVEVLEVCQRILAEMRVTRRAGLQERRDFGSRTDGDHSTSKAASFLYRISSCTEMMVAATCVHEITRIQSAHPNELHLCMAVVDYQTAFKRHKRGVCSTWLAGLAPGTEVITWYAARMNVAGCVMVECRTEPGTFRLGNASAPVLLIGAGTGVAPLRSIIEHESKRDMVLVFGSRHETADYYYREQWESCLKEGKLTQVWTAFSRDTKPKQYVQHRIAEHRREVYDILVRRSGFVFIAGNTKMPKDVLNVLVQIMQAEEKVSEAEAKAAIANLRNLKRIVIESW